tara:strand:- start:6131 stop:6547 length:417 start_codon:yes stop_codon:yes gene_type:complete
MGLKTDIKNAFIKSLGPDAVGEGNIDKLADDLKNAIVSYLKEQTFEITELKCDLEVEELKTTGPLMGMTFGGQTPSWPGGVTGPLQPVTVANINKLELNSLGGQGGALQSKGNAHINKKSNTPDNTSKIKLLTSVKEI